MENGILKYFEKISCGVECNVVKQKTGAVVGSSLPPVFFGAWAWKDQSPS